MLEILVASINPVLNNKIKDYVYSEKHKWKEGLYNVKALTSGYNPPYKFFDELYDFSYETLKKHTKKDWKKSCWWATYYSQSDHCDPHNHQPETLSAIAIVKAASTNPLYFRENDKEYDIKEHDGMMLFFDSKYSHGVRECKEERITCALDFVPKIPKDSRNIN